MSKQPPDAQKARPPLALLREAVRNFSRPLPGALTGDEEAVHALRVAARRLRVAIRVLARKPGGRRARRCLAGLENVTRLAGLSRDLDVAVEIWTPESSPATTRGERRLRASLRALRARARLRLAQELLDSDIARLRRRLRELLGRGCASRTDILERVRDNAISTGELIRLGFASVGNECDPVALHALRRRCRRMRYASEIVSALVGEAMDAASQFQRLQDLLGALHDRHVLGRLLVDRAASARQGGHADLGDAAEAAARWADAEVREHHRAVLGASPAGLAAEGVSSLLRRTGVSDPADAAAASPGGRASRSSSRRGRTR